MALDSGTKSPGTSLYSGSMADAMEKAFVEEWPTVMGDDADLPASSEQLNLMFRAIAQGVIRHLKQNSESLKVTVTVQIGPTTYTGTGSVTDIEIS
ncbi:MAG: hypothetical protein IPN31_09710 [Bacteroidetes bacterium]|nr:hypothetical protein [Bacteroidota bacterium]